MKRFILFFLLIFPVLLQAQVSDDFSDGDFTNNPAWSGDTSQFIVNSNQQLQLNASAPGTYYLATADNTSSLSNMEWDFWLKLAFSPSNNNNTRIYLVSDLPNLTDTVHGYYIGIGENGSFDSVDLWAQSGSNSTKIIDGINGHAAHATNILRIKVTRDNSGNWTVYSDTLGGQNFQVEGTVTDSTYNSSQYMGVYCSATSSNVSNFYYDDFYAGPIIQDTVAPVIDSLIILNSNNLDIYLNEPATAATANQTGNYSINNGLGNPASASLDPTYPNLIHLGFTQNFPDGVNNILTINGVADQAGNAMNNVTDTFLYHVPQIHDVVINEIMADPSPQVGQPNDEYVELYNTRNFPIDLKGWSLTGAILPDVSIPADSFLVLTSTSGAADFPTSINVLGVTSFPGLTNSGATITLRSNTGTMISSVSYTTDWYHDANKANGGWSLEQIDPANPCGEINNWTASMDPSGGTPGRKNSVYASNPDNDPPQLVRVGIIANDTIMAYFNESIDSASAMQATYTINNGIGTANSIAPVSPDFKSVKLGFGNTLDSTTIYTLTVNDSVRDCAGNMLASSASIDFGLPHPPAPFDVVLNELLPDPNTGGVSFIELYNRSDKVIDLDQFNLATYDTTSQTLSSLKRITDQSFLFLPHQYIALSTNGAIVRSQYYTSNPKGFLDVSSLPSMSISSGSIALATLGNVIIDRFAYNSSMYFPLLNSTKGVSLERIDYDRPTQDASNWHSAAETVGFATPAYQNSEFSKGGGSGDMTLSPEVFSPDNDGIDDVENISYSFDEPGYVGTIIIYDSKGREVRHLVQNQLLGTSGTYSWDGINDSGEKARIGIYIVYFDAFSTSGKEKSFKKTCVLGGHL